jgi:hypothetical protein
VVAFDSRPHDSPPVPSSLWQDIERMVSQEGASASALREALKSGKVKSQDLLLALAVRSRALGLHEVRSSLESPSDHAHQLDAGAGRGVGSSAAVSIMTFSCYSRYQCMLRT